MTIQPQPVEPRRVLLVEDHVDSARSISRLLRLFGYDVRVETDGLDAVRAAERFKPTAALIDLSIPSLDGFEVAQRLRASRATHDSLLIAMTGWSTDEHETRAREAGFDSHLVKPISVEALIGALSAVPAGRPSPSVRNPRSCHSRRSARP
jgi:DNA-binding response OmpR family regulator